MCPNADCILTKASLEPNIMFRICKADVTDDESQGILVKYIEHRREALSEYVNMGDYYFSNQTISGRPGAVVRTSSHCLQDGGCDIWY